MSAVVTWVPCLSRTLTSCLHFRTSFFLCLLLAIQPVEAHWKILSGVHITIDILLQSPVSLTRTANFATGWFSLTIICHDSCGPRVHPGKWLPGKGRPRSISPARDVATGSGWSSSAAGGSPRRLASHLILTLAVMRFCLIRSRTLHRIVVRSCRRVAKILTLPP